MNGERSTNKKLKTILLLFFCVSASDLTIDSEPGLYLKDLVYHHQNNVPLKLSSTDRIVLFGKKAIEGNYHQSVDQIEKSILKGFNYPYWSSHRENFSMLNLSQTSRIQIKALRKYFYEDITLHASIAQDLKATLADLTHYKSQLDSKKPKTNKKITKFFKPALLNKKKFSLQFNRNKGKLLLPTSGSIMKATGEPFTSGSVPWNGILISSQPNENVRAVGNGKVIFADEFIGFQAVVIVDHGNRYFTIYGNLSTIDVNLGQKIGNGEVVGRVGVNNITSINGLYFEIRKAGISLNSEQWFAN